MEAGGEGAGGGAGPYEALIKPLRPYFWAYLGFAPPSLPPVPQGRLIQPPLDFGVVKK